MLHFLFFPDFLNWTLFFTAVLDALCNPMIKLRNTFPITYSPETETRCKNFSPTENLSITTSMIQAGDTNVHQFPILNELMNFRSHMDGIRFGSWTFREVLDRLLAICKFIFTIFINFQTWNHNFSIWRLFFQRLHLSNPPSKATPAPPPTPKN